MPHAGTTVSDWLRVRGDTSKAVAGLKNKGGAGVPGPKAQAGLRKKDHGSSGSRSAATNREHGIIRVRFAPLSTAEPVSDL